MFLQPAGETASLNADAAMDIPEAAARLTAMRCYARFANISGDYPYDCAAHVPLPYPALPAAALEAALNAPSASELPARAPAGPAAQSGHTAVRSETSIRGLRASAALARDALCYAAAAGKLSDNDVASWHRDTTSAVLIMASVRVLLSPFSVLP